MNPKLLFACLVVVMLLALTLAGTGGMFRLNEAGFTGVGVAYGDDDSDSDSDDDSEAAADPQMVVALVGTDIATAVTLPDFGDGNGELAALCFTIDLVDVKTNKVIGEADDCLSNIDADTDAPGIKLTGTTIFNFPQGQLVSRGLTTVQPILHGANGFTHTTGAPAPLVGSNSNIIDGTKAFKNASGTVRLSGLVNLASFAGEGTPATFDCVFVVNLD